MKLNLQSTLFILLGIILTSFDYPASKTTLFTIGRSRDADEIFYTIKQHSNKLDRDEPIEIFWLKRTKNGKTEPLTWIQKRFSYGLKYLSVSEQSAIFQFVSYDKRVFELKKDSKGEFKVYTMSQGQEVEVNRIFISITGGSFWFPEISKVELYALVGNTGEKVIETVIP